MTRTSQARRTFPKARQPALIVATGDEATDRSSPLPRMVWILLELVRERRFAPAKYEAEFPAGNAPKNLQRDLRALRDLGKRFGFDLAPRRRGRAIELARLDGVAAPNAVSRDAADVLNALMGALGAVVAENLAGISGVSAAVPDGFLHVATPRLIEDSGLAAIFSKLRDGWRRRALVTFRYPRREPPHDLTQRVVEPHRVAYYSGRYYLVGFDVAKNAWRQYALDRIGGPVAFGGTIQKLRAVPENYSGDDAIGLFKTGVRHALLVELSPAIARAVTARRWQRAQRVELLPDGSARIELAVDDLGEGIRWALGFGAEARVAGPPEAVARARRLLAEMSANHAARDSVRPAQIA